MSSIPTKSSLSLARAVMTSLLFLSWCSNSLVSGYGLMVAPDIDQKRRTRMHPYSDEWWGYRNGGVGGGYGGVGGGGGGYYDNYAITPRRLGWDRDAMDYGYGVYNNNYYGPQQQRRLGWARDSYYGGGNDYYGEGDYGGGYGSGYNRYYGPSTTRRYGGMGMGGRRLGWDRDSYYGYNNAGMTTGGYGGNSYYGGYGSNYYYNPSSNYGYSSYGYGPSKYSYNERTGTFGYNDYGMY